MPQRVDQLLQQWMSRQGRTQQMQPCLLRLHWHELVGPRIAARTHPLYLYDSALTISVSSSAWLQQLSFLKDELIGRINKRFGDNFVTTIKLQAGAARQIPAVETCKARPVDERTGDVTVFDARPRLDPRSVELLLCAVEDTELQSAIRTALQTAM